MLFSFFNYITLLVLLICFQFSCFASTSKLVKCDSHDNLGCINIISDRLVIDLDSNVADFIGNIKLLNYSTILESDSLKIYAETNSNKDCNLFTIDTLNEAIAKGNVKIRFDNKIAMADCARYLFKDRILTLTGSDVSIDYVNNTVYGKKFVFFLDE